MDSYTFFKCPKCMADNIEVIPVGDYENYSFNINKIRRIGLNLVMTKLCLDK